jgi:hypothetical protein
MFNAVRMASATESLDGELRDAFDMRDSTN